VQVSRNRPPDPDAAKDAGNDHAPGARREPTIGDMDDVIFRAREGLDAARRARLRPRRRWWRWAIVLCAAAIAAAVLLRQPLAERVWPDTRAQTLRAQAAAALSQGRLTAPDGSGARELYEAALAIDPDRNEARAGLMRVAAAALAQARTQMAAGRFEQAHGALRLARELSVPRAEADAVAAELRRREAGHAGLDGMLAKARVALAEGHLDGSKDAALPLYRRVLELQPGLERALEGREDAIAELLQRARKSLDRGELAIAAASIVSARGYDAGHADLPEAQARLARAIEQVRQRADADLRAGNLDRAAQAYREVVEASGSVEVGEDLAGEASQGLQRIGLAHAARAERAAEDFRFDDAEALLGQAREYAPEAAAVRDAERHLQRARQTQARLGTGGVPANQRQARIGQLLAEAAAAEARGDLLTPPGDSAYDKLRAARSIAPDSPAVRSASARLLPAAKACFERELRGNNLARARGCLDARRVLEGDSNDLTQAGRRLAQRWLAIGDERLGAGEVAAAASALDAARRLDPAAPGLDAFAERVRAASAGTP
jgi:tetratricopeptide (TPR) repeat protein